MCLKKYINSASAATFTLNINSNPICCYLGFKKGLTFSDADANITKVERQNNQSLGVAQFGSVLEWGSRGRKFKSSHPDHNIGRMIPAFFLTEPMFGFFSSAKHFRQQSYYFDVLQQQPDYAIKDL